MALGFLGKYGRLSEQKFGENCGWVLVYSIELKWFVFIAAIFVKSGGTSFVTTAAGLVCFIKFS